MSLDSAHLDHARRVADAILYEGYLLYPYHKSALKNQVRFQFGVLMPYAYLEFEPSESSASQIECLLECPDNAEVRVLVRFLHVQRRIVQGISPRTGRLHNVGTLCVDGSEYTSWDEAVEREERVTAPVASLISGDRNLEFHVSGGKAIERLADRNGRAAGRLIRRSSALDGTIGLHAERVPGPYGAVRLRVRIENDSVPTTELARREDMLCHSLIAVHALIEVPGGTFLSMTDPPEWAAAEIAACENIGIWPVLAGPQDCHDLVLASPVILYDHPEIAAESAGDLFDATEIDEILTLRTLALTDEEKRQARATDPRAAQLLDRLDDMPPEMLDRMHGAIRYLRSAPAGAAAVAAAGQLPKEAIDWPAPEITDRPSAPWWDPGSDTSVSPETDHIIIDGLRIARGSRVLMRPGARRADAQDLFLVGRAALVEAVLHDVDGQVHLAVTPEDDPAADLQRNHGRYLYFAPDEVEPIDPAGNAGVTA